MKKIIEQIKETWDVPEQTITGLIIVWTWHVLLAIFINNGNYVGIAVLAAVAVAAAAWFVRYLVRRRRR